MEERKNVSSEIATEKEDFGFVGYRDYKESEFFKRYEAARAKVVDVAKEEIPAGPAKKEKVKARRGHAITIALFGVLYLALCVIGYFIHTEDILLGSIFGIYDGKSIIACVYGILDGSVSDIFNLVGTGAILVSAVLACLAVIGGIVDAAIGRGVGMLMKTGCTIQFFCVVIAMVAVIALRLDLTIGLAGAMILSGVFTLCALCAPNKVKEK